MESDFSSRRRRLRRPYGVKVEFFAGGTRPTPDRSTIFPADLVDDVFPKDSPFLKSLDGLPFETTYIKSASYLLHYRPSRNIRSLILAKSRFVLEDDTGIPLRFFPPETWQARLYGEYIKPGQATSPASSRRTSRRPMPIRPRTCASCRSISAITGGRTRIPSSLQRKGEPGGER